MQNNKNIFDFYQSSGIYDRIIFKNKNNNNHLTIEKLVKKTLSLGNIYNKRNDQLVFSDGNSKSKIMIIGDAPGISDEINKKPFSGDVGLLLNKMLKAINLDRTKVYLTNIINFRLPDNKKLSDNDIKIFKPLIYEHIEIINPKLIMLFGTSTLKTFFNNEESISKVRGKWLDLKIKNNTYICMLSFHPNFLLNQPSQKINSWQDLKEFKNRIDKDKLC
tara:strand:- start:684 stop:1340 length:657 start_codon:yes stop_codon:yes gene_type:complete